MHHIYVRFPWWQIIFFKWPFTWMYHSTGTFDYCSIKCEQLAKDKFFVTKIIYSADPVEWSIPCINWDKFRFWKK